MFNLPTYNLTYKLNLLRFSLLFFAFIIFSDAFAQEKAPVIELIDGNKYYIHKIEKGNTLYAISKKYLVEIDLILEQNPAVKDGLKIDQVIKIPLSRQNKNLVKANSPGIKADNMLHTVEKGQTLYSLSKLYNIDLPSLVEANAGIENGMKLGQVITIPVVKVKDIAPRASLQAKEDVLLRHKVEKGETVYSLASKYQVSADSISIINNGIPGGLKLGDSIIIPKKDLKKIPVPKSELKQDTVSRFIKRKLKNSSGNTDSLKLETYTVGLFLPFYLDENQLLNASNKEFEKEKISDNSAIGTSFYEGFLFALDSLVNEGLSIRLFVYDAGKDPAAIKELLLKPEMTEMDLIIGPLYSPGFSVVSDFALSKKINIISPFSNNLGLLNNNPYVSKPTSSQNTRMQEMLYYVSKNFSKENLILLNSNSESDKELVSVCTSAGKGLFNGKALKEISYQEAKLAGLKSGLSATQNNIIIVPSVDQAFVTQLITNINYWIHDYNITLVGLDNWMDFDNLDMSYLDKLNTHFPTSFHVDYESTDMKNFMKRYRSKYFIDPNHFAMQGFDIGYFYLSALLNNGLNLEKSYSEIKFKGLQTTFNLSRLNSNSGFENHGISIMKYDDFKLVKVN